MSVLRRSMSILLGCLLLGLAFQAIGQESPKSSPTPAPSSTPAPTETSVYQAKVRVLKADGTTVEGTSAISAVRLRSTIGTIDLNVKQVNSLVIENEDGTLRCTATLLDKSTHSGELLTTEFTMKEPAQTLPMADLHQISFDHPRDLSLGAILVGLITLVLLEIVLGIDNIVFISILSQKLPVEQQPRARKLGLAAALVTRLMLLGSLSFLLSLTEPIFTLPGMPWFEAVEAREISWRDLILLVGGIFLIGKSVMEIHEKIEHARQEDTKSTKAAGFLSVIIQIAILDIIFSLDSVITAVGMVGELWVMITAVIISIIVMMIFAESIARFIERRPTIKMLALSFLILIGVLLVAEALGQHFDKGYVYFAMAFALVMETLNMQLRSKH